MRELTYRAARTVCLLAATSLSVRAWCVGQDVRTATSLSATVLARAQQLRAQHKPEEAAALLQGYLAGHASDANAMALLAQIKVDTGDSEGARQLLEQALHADPTSSAANMEAGKMLLNAKQYPEAMDRFETTLANLPHDSEARRLEMEAASDLATQAQAAGHPEAAMQVWEHARGKMPDDPGLLLALGMQAFDLHRLQEAAEALQAARRIRPDDANILYGAARVALDQQHMSEAEADMRSYLALRPGDASAHFGLGHIYGMEQRSDDARAEFARSLQLQPVQTESYYQIGQLDLEAQRDAQAEPLFAKVIARDPKHGGALTGLGQIAFRAKKYSEAEAYLSRAVTAAPEYAPAHYYRGLVLARLGRKTEADAELHLATQLGHDAGVPAPGPPATEP